MYHHSLTESVSGHMFCFHHKPFINFSWSTRGSNMWRQMSSKPYKSGGHALLSDDLFGLKGPGLRGNGITNLRGLHRHQTSLLLQHYHPLRYTYFPTTCLSWLKHSAILGFGLNYLFFNFSYLSYQTPASGLLLWLSSVLNTYLKSSVSSVSL